MKIVAGHRILVRVEEDTVEKDLNEEIRLKIEKIAGKGAYYKGKKIFSAGGMELPHVLDFDPEKELERSKRAAEIGIVVQVGATAWADDSGGKWVKVGDKVVFKKYQGEPIPDSIFNDGFRYIVLNDLDVLFIDTIEE